MNNLSEFAFISVGIKNKPNAQKCVRLINDIDFYSAVIIAQACEIGFRVSLLLIVADFKMAMGAG